MVRPLSIVVVAALAVVAGVPGVTRAAASPADLLTRAKAARQEAQKDLADARKQRLDERRAVAARLQKQYDALARAKADADREQESLRRLEATSADLQRAAPLTDRRIQSTIMQAAGVAGVTVTPSDTIEEMERTLWQGLQRRLADIQKDARITVQPEPIIARNGDERNVPVARLGRFAAFACGDTRDTCGLLRQMSDGKWLVAGPYLSENQAGALHAAARGNLASLPLDIDGTLADRAPSEPKSAGIWLKAGGLFVYPILAVGALGLILVLERLIYLVFTKTPPLLIQNVLPCLERRDVEAAREVLRRSRTPAARVLLAGVESMGKNEEERGAAMDGRSRCSAPWRGWRRCLASWAPSRA